MQVFPRSAVMDHSPGAGWPVFLGRVALGEPFVVETESDGVNGPVEVIDIAAGDPIAVHVEAIEMVPPFIAPNGGPFVEGMGPPVEVDLRDGYFYWPQHFRLRAEPSVGNIAVLPAPTEPVLQAMRAAGSWRALARRPRGKHCHYDCRALGEGSILHLRAQVGGAGLCLDDVHGYIGQGELAFAAIELRGRVRLRVERSVGWHVDWPLIETADSIRVIVSDTSTYTGRSMPYVELVREAYWALREVVARRIGGSIEEANPIVATAADLENCALYGLGEGYIPQHRDTPPFDLAVAARLPKHVFRDER
jgi:acetamidase/formamidase